MLTAKPHTCRPVAAVGPSSRQSGRHQRLAVTALFSTGGLGLGSKEVYVTGARGQIAMRVVQKLLVAGKKVSAVVPDEDEAQGVVDFAKNFKLLSGKEAKNLKLIEVDPSDQDALAAVLARAGTAVVVLGDSYYPFRVDSKAPAAAIAAAQEASVGRVVLVGPRQGGGGLFGGGRASPEKALTDSGLSYAILRTAKPDFEAQGTGLGELSVGADGSLPRTSSITLDQIGQAAAALVDQARSNVTVEAWASADAEAAPAEDLVAQVLAEASASAEPEPAAAEAEEEEPAEPQAPKQKRGGLFGGRGSRSDSADDEDWMARGEERGEQKAREQAKKMRAGSFMRSAGDRAEDTRVAGSAQEPTPQPRGFFGFGGSKPSPAQEAQKSAARGIEASGREAGRKAKAAARSTGEDAGPEKKTQGFLQRLGLGQAVDVEES